MVGFYSKAINLQLFTYLTCGTLLPFFLNTAHVHLGADVNGDRLLEAVLEARFVPGSLASAGHYSSQGKPGFRTFRTG
jgi:hypothetical protein